MAEQLAPSSAGRTLYLAWFRLASSLNPLILGVLAWNGKCFPSGHCYTAGTSAWQTGGDACTASWPARVASGGPVTCRQTPCSEVVRRPHPDAVDPAVDDPLRRVAVLGDVVELDFHVRVEEPVQAQRPVVDVPALDTLVVEVEVA